MDIECSKCGVSKAREAFYKRGDGLRTQCKECESAAYKQWASLNAERRKAINDRYEEANPDRAGKYRAENPVKVIESTKKWRAKNYERFYAKTREWVKAHPEHVKTRAARYRDAPEKREQARARTVAWRKENPDKQNAQSRIKRARRSAAAGRHTPQEWIALVKRYRGFCLCCKKHFGLRKLTEDHIVPLSRGGSDDIENIQPLCGSCNTSKGNRHATDFRNKWEPAEAGPRS